MTIADLLDAGLLAEGNELTFSRPRFGEAHRATVTERGKLRLDDGQEFPTPSRAAWAAAGRAGAFDGWHAWIVSPGTSLDSLRQRLLEQAAQDTPDEADEAGRSRQQRFAWLSEARTRADADDPVVTTVRDLLGRWDETAGGGSDVETRIEADLANHDLTTAPSFRKVSLDSAVRIVTRPQDENAVNSLATMDDEEELYVGLTVGNIPSALGGVDWVPPNATFEQAISKMRLNGYSQLAVLAGPRNLRGAVTWESIAYRRHHDPGATFADAIVPAREAHYDQALIDVLRDLEDEDFIFVLDETNRVAGIITTADVVAKYREIANPFILIGELDQVLRQIISRTFTLPEITPLCDRAGRRAITSFQELEMGDYQAILGNPARWAQLGWKLDRAEFIGRLDELRKIRNDVTHFNPRPLPPNAIRKMRKMLDVLRDLGSPAG